MPNIFHRIKQILSSKTRKPQSWKDIEHFDPQWEERIKLMARYIKTGESVLDLGCGTMTLAQIRTDIDYFPVDYAKRSPDTIVCDFNKKEFPSRFTDVGFVSGCLEYVEDYEWFIGKICAGCQRAIISYCTTDQFPDKSERIKNNWVNNLSEKNIVDLFRGNRFALRSKTKTVTRNSIFVFESE